MTVTIETAEYALELAQALEESVEDDGCHLGPTDAGFAARILRLAEAAGLLSNVVLIEAEVA